MPADAQPQTPPWLARTAAAVSRGTSTLKATLGLAIHTLERADALVTTAATDSRRVADDAVAFWSTVTALTSKVAAMARATPRLAAVLTELTRLAATYRLVFWKAGFLPIATRDAWLETVHRREGARLRRFCEAQGGGLMKLGQVLSTRADLLPTAFVAALTDLTDQAEPPSRPEVESALDTWLGPTWRDELELLEPLAAASIAVVYRARLGDREVAVKIQRPGVDRLIAEDRAAMALIGRLVREALPTGSPLKDLDLAPILAEVGESLTEELDFLGEYAHAERFRAALTGTCVVPGYLRAPHDKVLVMELIDGQRLPDALATASPDEVAALLAELARTLSHAILVHGLVHGDPHPGNVLVLSAGQAPRLVLLDFGSALVLEPTTRKAYAALMLALMSRSERPLARALTDLGFARRDGAPAAVDLDALAADLAAMPRPADLAGVDPHVELERAMTLIKRHAHLAIPPHLVRVSRALGTLGGLFLTHRAALTGDRLDLGRLLMEALLAASRTP